MVTLGRLLGLVACLLGLAGTAIGLAGIYGVWWTGSRLDDANHQVVARLDQGVGRVQEQIPLVQIRVEQARITTADMTEAVKAWTSQQALERLVQRVDLSKRTEKLTGQFQIVDLRLEAAGTTLGDVRGLVVLGQSLGLKLDPATLDRLIEQIDTLRGKMQVAERSLDDIRRLAQTVDEDAIRDRRARILEWLGRVLVTLVDVEARLNTFGTILEGYRSDLERLRGNVSRSIRYGEWIGTALLAWGSAGQLCLMRWGWTCLRRRTHPA